MKLKSNFSRNVIMAIFSFLQGLFLAIPALILLYYYKMPLGLFMIVSLSYILFVAVEPFSATKNIFSKYCNRECKGCSMWHCDLHYKDGKYVK